MAPVTKADPVSHRLAERLRKALEGEVLFDRFSRGRYATDASHYQIEPVGVVVPKSDDDVRAALEIAREEGVPLLPRGGGTSQSGQTVGRALVLDFSKYLKRIVALDAEAGTCVVEPGIVLDDLNRQIRASGLWFPVDVSTASRATIGGMAGNNSCGTRSIRYGIMRDNVLAIDAILADGSEARFGEVGHNLEGLPLPALRQPPNELQQRGERAGVRGSPTLPASEPLAAPHPNPLPARAGRGDPGGALGEGAANLALFRDLLALGRREAEHVASAFPEVSRRVGGYLIDALVPGSKPVNLATLLCGSEGTLAVSRRIELKLSPLPRNKALGICHFATFRKAMEATRHIVRLGPVAVEVVDRTLIELACDIAMFRPVMDTYVRGQPDALLLVEFAEDDQAENLRRARPARRADGRPRPPQRRREGAGRGRAEGGVGGARLRPQHHDVHEVRGEARVLHRGLRGAPGELGRLHRAPHRGLCEARHARHLLRPRLGGLPARAPRAQPQAGAGRPHHARDRRGGFRHGEGVQGLALGRARRRPRPLRVP